MANASEDETVIIRNLKDSAALLPRIAALRQVLSQLRMALRRERENLSKEINTIKWLEVGKTKKRYKPEDDSNPFLEVGTNFRSFSLSLSFLSRNLFIIYLIFSLTSIATLLLLLLLLPFFLHSLPFPFSLHLL